MLRSDDLLVGGDSRVLPDCRSFFIALPAWGQFSRNTFYHVSIVCAANVLLISEWFIAISHCQQFRHLSDALYISLALSWFFPFFLTPNPPSFLPSFQRKRNLQIIDGKCDRARPKTSVIHRANRRRRRPFFLSVVTTTEKASPQHFQGGSGSEAENRYGVDCRCR